MYSRVQQCTVQFSSVQYSSAMYSTVQQCTVELSSVRYSSAVYSTVQQCTAQFSSVQYSSAVYSTVQQWRKKTTKWFEILDTINQYHFAIACSPQQCAAVITTAAAQHTVACLTAQNCPFALHNMQLQPTIYCSGNWSVCLSICENKDVISGQHLLPCAAHCCVTEWLYGVMYWHQSLSDS
jgi:hypothetical protein